MVYTKKHPALLVMGVLLLLLGGLTNAGVLDGVIGYLKIGGKTGEITALSYVFGTISVLIGIWHMWGKHVEGNPRREPPGRVGGDGLPSGSGQGRERGANLGVSRCREEFRTRRRNGLRPTGRDALDRVGVDRDPRTVRVW